MPRTALIADIHANLEAFHAVLRDIASQDVDRIVCLGDIVGYGPDPAECLELAFTTADRIVLGNHDEAAANPTLFDRFNDRARASLEYTHAALSEQHINAILKLPDRAKDNRTSYAHASFGESQYEYLYTEDCAERSFAGLHTPIGAVGHTHIPTLCSATPALGGIFRDVTVRTLPANIATPIPDTGLTIVNPGSVGQPRDRNPDAAWAILDDDNNTIQLRRVPYDIDAVLAKIHNIGLPDTLADRLLIGA